MHCHLITMKNLDKTKNADWGLLTKFLANEADSEEKTLVYSWLESNEDNRKLLDECRKTLENADNFYKAEKFDSHSAWTRLHSKIIPGITAKPEGHKKYGKEGFTVLFKYAAILIVAIFLGVTGYYLGFRNDDPEEIIQITSTDNQIPEEYVLADGTVVTLNNRSTLLFSSSFNLEKREVTISGEAFFEVKPNAEKPFVIHAGNARVEVLGTSFNVCAYPETETVEVVVETGKVQISCKNPDETSGNQDVLILPGEKGIVYNHNQVVEKDINRNPNFLAWKTHHFKFSQMPLDEVIMCLEKVYQVDILLKESELNDLMLTAQFEEKPVDFILNVIRLTFNLNLSAENEQFILSGRHVEQ